VVDASLVQEVVAFVAPVLPFLAKMGEKAADEAAKKIGVDGWEKAKAVWGDLAPALRGPRE